MKVGSWWDHPGYLESKVERFSWRALVLGVVIGLAGALGALGLTGSESDAVAEKPQAKGIRAIATSTVISVEEPPSAVVEKPLSDAKSSPRAKSTDVSNDSKITAKAIGSPTSESVKADTEPTVAAPTKPATKSPVLARPELAQDREMGAAVTEDASAVEAIGLLGK